MFFGEVTIYLRGDFKTATRLRLLNFTKNDKNTEGPISKKLFLKNLQHNMLRFCFANREIALFYLNVKSATERHTPHQAE
jgi:hypothetical protein